MTAPAKAPLMRPLQGLRVTEFEGIGPGPLCGRILADMGATVHCIVRPWDDAVSTSLAGSHFALRDGKQLHPLDLKQAEAREHALALVAESDILIEGNRPGVMERLGLGPAACAARQPRLVYGRMTGWGQSGPLAQAAGHDINYLALSGVLGFTPQLGAPPTVLGDAGGALALAFGLVSGVWQARARGEGCVVDAAIVDSLAMLGGIAQWIAAGGGLGGPAPSAFHDSPFYDCYDCQDGGRISLGPLEPRFYALLLQTLELDDVDPAAQYDTAQWPALKTRLRELFLSQPRAYWCERLEGTDVCFAPVLSMAEAAAHPHNAARGLYQPDSGGALRGAAAPRFLPLPEQDGDTAPSSAPITPGQRHDAG